MEEQVSYLTNRLTKARWLSSRFARRETVGPGRLLFRTPAPSFRWRLRRLAAGRRHLLFQQAPPEFSALERDGKWRAGKLPGVGKRRRGNGGNGAFLHDRMLEITRGLTILSLAGVAADRATVQVLRAPDASATRTAMAAESTGGISNMVAISSTPHSSGNPQA